MASLEQVSAEAAEAGEHMLAGANDSGVSSGVAGPPTAASATHTRLVFDPLEGAEARAQRPPPSASPPRPPLRTVLPLEAQLLACSLRYGITTLATHLLTGVATAPDAAAPAPEHLLAAAAAAGDAAGSAGLPFAASLALGCAAGLLARAAVGGGLGLLDALSGGVPASSEAAAAAADLARRKAAAPVSGGSGVAPPSATAAVARLSRGATAGAVQLAAYTLLLACTAPAAADALNGVERQLVAGALAGAVSVALTRPLNLAWRKAALGAAMKTSPDCRRTAAKIVAAADITAMAAVECTCAALGCEPVYW